MCKLLEEMKDESRQEGKEEGIKENSIDVARRMLDAGKYSLEEIVNISGLAFKKVRELEMARKV